MIILLRLRVGIDIEAIKWFLILPILKNGLLLLSYIALHLYLLVQIANIGLSDAFIGHKLLHFSLNIAQELLTQSCQSTAYTITFSPRIQLLNALVTRESDHLVARIDVAMTLTVRLKLLHVFEAFDNDAAVADLGQGVGERTTRIIS